MDRTLVVYQAMSVVATSCAQESRRTDLFFTVENIVQMLHGLVGQSLHLVGFRLRV
jgi:hypothetical protein